MDLPFTPEQLEAIRTLCREHGVERLRLTGSRVEPGLAREDSDYDFLVVFGDPPEGMTKLGQIAEFQEALESILAKACDIIHDSSGLSPWWRESFELGAQNVFAA